ncbi:hypothetical protein C5167_004891 [Papaver somniferum]|uniref:Uncharacterized protein n=1 Tax=Papaver somniferum TaxID=3469 RepID=A0A4Y7JCR0_PAPSO|nr:hypothetical protein C5167_004891 [Papaver somniferum]
MNTTELPALKTPGVLHRKIKKGVLRRSKNLPKMKAIETAISRGEKVEKKISKKCLQPKFVLNSLIVNKGASLSRFRKGFKPNNVFPHNVYERSRNQVSVQLGCYRSVKGSSGPWYCELCEDLLASRSFRVPVKTLTKSLVFLHHAVCMVALVVLLEGQLKDYVCIPSVVRLFHVVTVESLCQIYFINLLCSSGCCNRLSKAGNRIP